MKHTESEVDLAAKTVTAAGHREIRLTPTEWHILEILVRNAGKLVDQRRLLQEVWGPAYRTKTNYLRVYLAPGASGTAASMRPWTDGLKRRGFDATPIQLPRGTTERAIPVYRAAVVPGPGVVIGGRGGIGCREGARIASRRGFNRVRPIDCGGETYRYEGWRGGEPWRIRCVA